VVRCRGFTLVEVIIALSILSMIMVATISSLRTFGNTRAVIERSTSRVDEVRQVSAFLRASIQGALPVVRLGDNRDFPSFKGNYGTFFGGATNEMMWVAPVTAGAGFGGTFVNRLSREGGRLVLRWLPYKRNVGDLDWSRVKGEVLTEEVERFALGYRQGYESEWLDTWEDTSTIPASVRLSLKSRGRHWPELVVRLDPGQLNLR
jgi:general secretion pathway protein J